VSSEKFLPYEPQERQRLLHNSKCRQIIFGGAAGGGKSHACRWDLIRFATRNPGFQGYLFRESRRQLESTHIRPIKLLFGKNPDLGKYNAQRNAAEFNAFDEEGHIVGQSVIYMCYCENLDDAFGYLSEEMHACVIDEASRFSPDMLAVLKTRVRLGGWSPTHPKDTERLPRFVMASNPGGPGHGYIKSLKDKAVPEKEFFDEQMRDPKRADDQGWSTVFIPSKMADNRFLDSDYGAAFGMLAPEQQRAYREGDWDAVVGAALHNLARDTHQLGIFKPPSGWLRFCAMDWGMARPFSIGWYTVCDDDHWIKFKHSEGGPKFVPRGAVVRYRELYGWGGKENVGCAWTPARVAAEIKKIESTDSGPIAYRVADTEIWAQHGGPTVAEMFAEYDIFWTKAQKDRVRNYQQIISRLAGEGDFDPTGRMTNRPMFFVAVNCVHWWRTVPTLLMDPLEPEKGPTTKNCEDHAYDETAYALRSRPWIAEPSYDDGSEIITQVGNVLPYQRVA